MTIDIAPFTSKNNQTALEAVFPSDIQKLRAAVPIGWPWQQKNYKN